MSRFLACCLCLLASPAFGQLVIQDGDHYQDLTFSGASMLMTGGVVEKSMRLSVDEVTIEGGRVGVPTAQITASGGTFNISGGEIYGGIYCDRSGCGVHFTGYDFRSYKYEYPLNHHFYYYTIEGVLSDGHFIQIGLQADSLSGGANIAPFFNLLNDSLPGDTNGDFAVDLADLNTIRNNFGLRNADRKSGDLDADGLVGLSDLNEARNTFGSGARYTLGPEYDVRQQPVPEPASFITAAVLGLGVLAGTLAQHRCR